MLLSNLLPGAWLRMDLSAVSAWLKRLWLVAVWPASSAAFAFAISANASFALASSAAGKLAAASGPPARVPSKERNRSARMVSPLEGSPCTEVSAGLGHFLAQALGDHCPAEQIEEPLHYEGQSRGR